MIPICNACEANTPSARSSPIPPTVTHQTPSSPVVPRSLTHHVSHTQLSPSPPSRLSHALPVATHKPLAQRASLAQLFTPSPTSTSLAGLECTLGERCTCLPVGVDCWKT
ncbi:uncharacterized protein BT62DRAFT_1011679 [Guyanagaster necrorhizus]|uniref:Uncharacterized protein n=1 Tax=Guyanagaster necrorhizus TaxID=856835 RepID=A0A9P8AMN1_9AGAR|nr:uncharacterized protein BT62DRAFT_1011679 [Guyanagaster necrorhizus MCA 3950]KAG7441423.1 hypothetical protein BT62DRAFT_1011679 [Guyanagaster necrorhizus MCA 3950]